MFWKYFTLFIIDDLGCSVTTCTQRAMQMMQINAHRAMILRWTGWIAAPCTHMHAHACITCQLFIDSILHELHGFDSNTKFKKGSRFQWPLWVQIGFQVGR